MLKVATDESRDSRRRCLIRSSRESEETPQGSSAELECAGSTAAAASPAYCKSDAPQPTCKALLTPSSPRCLVLQGYPVESDAMTKPIAEFLVPRSSRLWKAGTDKGAERREGRWFVHGIGWN